MPLLLRYVFHMSYWCPSWHKHVCARVVFFLFFTGFRGVVGGVSGRIGVAGVAVACDDVSLDAACQSFLLPKMNVDKV